MENFDKKIIRLIQLHLTGQLTEEEQQELNLWYDLCPENREFLDQIRQDDLLSREYPLYETISEQKALRSFEKTIVPKRYLFTRVLKYTAILILPLLGITIWQLPDTHIPELISQQITPGSSKATLTLASGEQIDLNPEDQREIQAWTGLKIKNEKGQLSYDTLSISDVPDKKYNLLSTGIGGEYRLILADGTKVYLNAATTLKYPITFSGDTRKVELKGEAYFEVSKDTKRPFIVQVEGMDIKVLGTSFNVNTFYPDKIKTVLAEGSIQVHTHASGKDYLVRPGEMLTWKKSDDSVELKEVDVSVYTAWKEGVFRFENERLENLLITLANWYGIEIFYKDTRIKELHFSGYLNRYEQIDTILEAITEATGVQFDIQGKNICVSK